MYTISTSTKFESSYSHVYVCVTLDLVKNLECDIMIRLIYLKEDEAKVVKVHIGRVVNVEGKPGFAEYHDELIRDGWVNIPINNVSGFC